jgi:uncharacterized membrane protein YagU involved in acid resistance
MSTNLRANTTSTTGPAALQTIVLGGLIAGTLDALDAVVFYKASMGISAGLIFKNIASGLQGMSAFSGGRQTAVLGLGLHYVISLGAAAVFYLFCLRWKALFQKPWIFGPAFGVAVYLVMHYLVLPLSAVPPRRSPMGWPEFLNLIFAHVAFVGLPIALVASWSARTRALAQAAGSH